MKQNDTITLGAARGTSTASPENETEYGRSRGRFRTGRIKKAVYYSILSKVTTIALHLLAFPIGIKALGVDRFGVYVTLTALLGWIAMTQLGIGPALTLGIALNSEEEGQESESRYFSTSLFLMLVTGMILLALLFLAVVTFSPASLLGSKYARFSEEMRWGTLLLGSMLTIQLVFSVFPAARAGYQEVHVNYIWTIVGNVLSCFFIVLVAIAGPSVYGFLAAVQGGPLLGSLGNGLALLIHDHPHLWPRIRHFDFSITRRLLEQGLAFTFVQASVYVNRQLSLLILGRLAGPAAVTVMAVIFRLVLLAQGVVTMVTQPLWPAVMDAVVRKDFPWIQKSYSRTSLFSMIYAVATAAILGIWGESIIKLWIGPEVVASPALTAATGLYFVLLMWTHVAYTVTIGLGRINYCAFAMGLECLLGVGLCLCLIPWMGTVGLPIALCLAMAGVTAWAFPMAIRRALGNAQNLSPLNGTSKAVSKHTDGFIQKREP